MRSIKSLCLSSLLVSALLATVAVAASKADLAEQMSHDGLSKVKVKGLDLVYKRPEASLAGYNRIILAPIEVAFHKDWKPEKSGSRLPLNSTERETIRADVAKLVQEELVKELQRKGGIYQVVNAAGPDVLRLKASIQNLYINAPDTMDSGRSRAYTMSAGEMTIFAELFDSESGEVIARVVDRSEAADMGMMTLTNKMVNDREGRILAANWGRILRKALDTAHDIGK